MPNAKDIVVKPITRKAADRIVKSQHYSGKTLNNSKLHLGVFLNDRLSGAMQFGPSLDNRKTLGLVSYTKWNDFLELNRMAFSDNLPRNSESRALAIAFRMIKKTYPNIEWILTFADGTQCGDGTIYRAAGFDLIGIKKNTQIIEFPDGVRETRLVLTNATRPRRLELAKKYGADIGGGTSLKPFLDIGAKALPGFQLRYIKFLNSDARSRLTVPVLPYSKIDEMGAGMYKGHRRGKQAMADDQSAQRRGSTDRHAPINY